MKAWGRPAAVALCASLALFVAPAGAAAKPGYFVSGPGRSAKVHLRGSGGYGIEVTAYASGEVVLTARKGTALAFYAVRGKLRDDGSIEARFPGRGVVSVAFRARGRARERAVPASCRGRKTIVRRGVFAGRIRFRGERGFTRVRTLHALGRVLQHFKRVCHRPEGGSGYPGGQPRTMTLVATRRQGKSALSFSATRLFSEQESSVGAREAGFGAVLARVSKGMTEIRSASAIGRATAFAAELGQLESATLSPPRPFTGTASFSWAEGQDPTWTGSLSVELPGAGEVSLAGPKFSAELCSDRRCTESSGASHGSFSGSFFAAPGEPQLSGSHSQALGDARLSWSR